MPKTRLGQWSVGLLAFFIVLFGVFQVFVATGQRGGDTIFSNPLLAVPISLAGLAGISAFFTGTVCIIKNTERPFLVWIASIVGFVVFVFILGELLFPH
ncbi:MAG: hypothetical protein ACRKGH_06515 [Dehalogenimonas sp.]